MIRSITIRLSRESTESMLAAGRYNRARTASFRDGNARRCITLGAGTYDTVDAYRAHGAVYIVTINRALGYCGVERFTDGEASGDCFAQVDHEIASVLAPDGDGDTADGVDYLAELDDREVAARLIAYLDEVCS